MADVFRRLRGVDATTMSRFADCAVPSLPEATPLELARLMHACMRPGEPEDHIYTPYIYIGDSYIDI